MSEYEFNKEQFEREKREWVLKMLDGLYHASPETVIEWIHKTWPHGIGLYK